MAHKCMECQVYVKALTEEETKFIDRAVAVLSLPGKPAEYFCNTACYTAFAAAGGDVDLIKRGVADGVQNS